MSNSYDAGGGGSDFGAGPTPGSSSGTGTLTLPTITIPGAPGGGSVFSATTLSSVGWTVAGLAVVAGATWLGWTYWGTGKPVPVPAWVRNKLGKGDAP